MTNAVRVIRGTSVTKLIRITRRATRIARLLELLGLLVRGPVVQTTNQPARDQPGPSWQKV